MNVRRRLRGYTMTEVLVATFIMSMIVVVLWRLVETTGRMHNVAAWQSARQTELRVGLQMLRDDLMRACYPTKVTRSSSELVDAANHKLGYKSGGPFTLPGGASGVVLQFYVCKPWKDFPTGSGLENSGNVRECRLEVEGNKLRYIRQSGNVPGGPGSDPDLPDYDKILINDVSELDIQVTATASTEYTMRFCNITVTCLHPRAEFDKTKVTQQTGAKIEVDETTI